MEDRIDRVFAAVSDPTRRALLTTLTRGPCRAGDLARPHDVSRPAISRHLRVMRDAGLVAAEQRGREQWYHLAPQALDDAAGWMAEASEVWPRALTSLKRHVEAGS